MGITDIDPIVHNLYFERFLAVDRCLDLEIYCKTINGSIKLKNIKVGDYLENVINGKKNKVIKIVKNKVNKIFKIKIKNQTFICSENHKWIVERDNELIEVMTKKLKLTDKLLKSIKN